MIVPRMPKTAMIILSILLGIQLLALLLLALYSSLSPRWTDTFDSFAMMRIGSALDQKTLVPLMVGREVSKIRMLDTHPGWIGGSAQEIQEGIVQLDLGGVNALNRNSILLRILETLTCHNGILRCGYGIEMLSTG